jgi:sugar phosphate isomerase/epimerase
VASRLAAISDDLSTDFADAARLAAELGVDGLGVRHVGGVNVRDLDDSTLASIRRTADAHGIAISAVSSPLGRDLYLGDHDAPALAVLDRMIQTADVLECSLIRVFATWLPGKDALPEWWERPSQTPAEVAERMSVFAERAERAGVTLMLELEGASYVGRLAEARDLFAAVDSPALALCWDVCNGWWSGERPWPEGWQIARSLPIVDVQFKDVGARFDDPGRPDYNQVVLGEGVIPYEHIVDALTASGYDGWFTAERVYHPRRPEQNERLQADIVADISRLKTLIAA